MKKQAGLLLLLFLGCQNPEKSVREVDSLNAVVDSVPAETAPDSYSAASGYSLVTWMRKTPAELGCMFESEFSVRDSVFNCAYKNYKNNGDPCVNTEEYYEGVRFPVKMVEKVHPSIKTLTIDFEHGSLREIAIEFKDSIRKDKVKELFALPDASDYPDNVMQIQYGENVYSKNKPADPLYTRWLTITGFEHIGAGDADCGE